MQSKFFLLASVASLAAAQTATTSAAGSASTSTCLAQNVLDACKATEQAQINSCATNDYSCLCSAWTSMLTCYNQCPNDPMASTVSQERTLYCNDASAYPSTSTHAVVASTTMTSATSASGTSVASGFSTSGTKTGSSSTATSNAGDLILTNSLLLVAAGAFALL